MSQSSMCMCEREERRRYYYGTHHTRGPRALLDDSAQLIEKSTQRCIKQPASPAFAFGTRRIYLTHKCTHNHVGLCIVGINATNNG